MHRDRRWRGWVVVALTGLLGVVACGGDGASLPDSRTGAVDTFLDGTPAAVTNAAQAQFQFSANLDGGSFECSIDDASPAACSSPLAYPVTVGPHTFAVTAIDAGGLADPSPAAFAFEVDRQAPTITLDDNPGGLSGATAVFAFSASEPGVVFTCSIDGGPFEPCDSPLELTGLTDGDHTLVIQATDAAGNVGNQVTYTWTVDNTAPIVAIVDGPTDPTNLATATFTFVADEVATFMCDVAGVVAATPCASPWAIAVPDGDHTFTVVATDLAGNTAAASWSWSVVAELPAVTIVDGPAPYANQSSVAFTFTTGGPVATTTCALDGGAASTCSSPVAIDGLADGAHELVVTVDDGFGSTDQDAWAFAIDTIAPVVAITAPADGAAVANPVTVSFTITSDDGGDATCAVDAGAFGACASPTVVADLIAGPHTLAVRAVDTAGNVGQASHSVTVVVPVCGDGVRAGAEACDDGNTVDGDGCSADCGSTETCGNGVLDLIAGEACDDGNAIDNDCCPNSCRPREQWKAVASAAVPAGRWTFAMTQGSTNGDIMLFGGQTAGYVPNNETWVWDGTNWTRYLGASPGTYYVAQAAWDATRQQVVLFGGANTVSSFDAATWLWNGASWTQAAPATVPPGRHNHAMAWDPVREQVVMFGGRIQNGVDEHTWTWDGTDWTEHVPVHTPIGRILHQMAQDPVRGVVVLYGGQGLAGTPSFGDTWAWDGIDWTQQNPVTSPPPLDGAAMAWDPIAEAVSVTQGGGMYRWTGTTWVGVSTSGALNRIVHGLAFDGHRRHLLIFGSVVGALAAPQLLYPSENAACLVPGPCGDGVVDAGETCDDGNNIDGDGCPANCAPP